MMLTLGEIPFKDERISIEQWPSLKSSMKWGQVPVLITPEGKEMTQNVPITLFLAKQVKVDGKLLYPEDPMLAFEAMEMISAFDDVHLKIRPSMFMKDQQEKEAFRAKLFTEDGDCTTMLARIESLVGEKFIVGSCMTVADIYATFYLNFLRCGFLEGVPSDYLAKYPKLAAIVSNVLSLPALKAYYAKMAVENPMYRCFLV